MNDIRRNPRPFKDKYTVLQALRTSKMLHNCDLLAVHMNDGTYTIFKNRVGLEHGTIIHKREFKFIQDKSYAPIVFSEVYIETDEEGKVIYQ